MNMTTLQKMIVEITINWLPQFRKSIVFETELTKKMFILTIIFYSESFQASIEYVSVHMCNATFC